MKISEMEEKSAKEKRREFLCGMSTEDRIKFIREEKAQKELVEIEFDRVSTQGMPLVFDLGFTGSMSRSEINSMVAQIRLSVGFLRKHLKQYFRLVCVNVSDEIAEILEKKGRKRWKIDVFSGDVKGLGEMLEKDLVMLSPDAEELLIDVRPEEIYVIGGLVDKTVKAMQTLTRSREINIVSRRLPVKESLRELANPFKLKKVLNINTVVEVLHYKASGLSWEECFLRSIPSRWLKK